jgi:hypothetical protein
MTKPSLAKYRYRVDGNDVLVWVDSWWLAFARENGGPELTKEYVLGRSLWDFIADSGTRELYQQIHQQLRAGRQRVVLPFRCDSPTVNRHMQLTITTEPNGQLSYESVLLRAETHRKLALLDRDQRRSDAFLTVCSCCMTALLEPSGWLDLAEVVVRLHLLESERAPRLRHVTCPRCADQFRLVGGNGTAA